MFTKATLCIPVMGNPIKRILLGIKKTGFGQGKITGFGGKVKSGETTIQAALREFTEETTLLTKPENITSAGHLRFVFPAMPVWNHDVHVYLVHHWVGKPKETTEMKPLWFKRHSIPYGRMWADGKYWLPLILQQKEIEASFVFDKNNHNLARLQITALDNT